MNRLLGLVFFLAIVAIGLLNYQQLLSFGQERMVYQDARGAIAAHNWEKAIEAYKTGMRQYPGNMAVAQKLGWLYERNNQPAQAEKVYRNILDRQPGYLDARIGIANIMKEDPLRINEAVDEFRKALKTHPDDAILLGQIGNLYKTAAENSAETREQTRRWLYDQARYYYQLSLKLDPAQFQTLFNQGVAYQFLREREPAARSYCDALAVNPDSYQARFNLGLILSDLNYLDEAYRQLDRAVALVSEEGDAKKARQIAQQAQNVKNAIYNNPDKRGLTGGTVPPMLNPACLYKPKNPN